MKSNEIYTKFVFNCEHFCLFLKDFGGTSSPRRIRVGAATRQRIETSSCEFSHTKAAEACRSRRRLVIGYAVVLVIGCQVSGSIIQNRGARNPSISLRMTK